MADPTPAQVEDNPPAAHVSPPPVIGVNAANLGGEPVAIIAAIQALAAMAVTFGWLDGIGLHSQHDAAVVVLSLNAAAAVYLAFMTHATILSPVVELVKALLAVGVIYGLHITTEQTGMVIAAVTAVLAAFNRTQVSPLQRGTFSLHAAPPR